MKGKHLALAALTLGMSSAFSDHLKDISALDNDPNGGKKGSRSFKNTKKVSKDKRRNKNKLARAARKKNKK